MWARPAWRWRWRPTSPSRYPDGAWYVDLVPVTDTAMVGAAVASAFGFGEQLGRSPTDTVIAKLAGAEALVVLDNCEHLVDGVTAFVERLLSACPRTTVLATSRARLLVPFEWVFPVPGLSLDDDGGEGDAVALFVERAAMAGWSSPYPDDRRRIAAICAELDGIALAIELAAARLATFGLDGLEAGLADRLGLLAGGPRLDDRHRSVRSALDWSFGLLDEKDQVVLRRASVFAAPFTSAAAATVTGHAPLMPGRGGGGAGPPRRPQPAGGGRRSRRHPLPDVGDDPAVRRGADGRGRRGDRRCEAATCAGAWRQRLGWRPSGDTGAGFDEVADDLRAGLGWAADQPDAAGRRPRAGRAPGRAHLRPGDAERGPAAVRGGGRAGRAIPPKRPGPCTSERPWPGAGRRATRRCGCTAPPPRRPAGPVTGARAAVELATAAELIIARTGHHVRAGAARRGAGPAGRGVDAGVR